MKDKSQLTEESLPGLVEIVGEEEVAQRVLRAAKSSMGMDTSEQDMLNIIIFTERMISLALYRKQLFSYLEDKMAVVAVSRHFSLKILYYQLLTQFLYCFLY